jgi:hypothetical protein
MPDLIKNNPIFLIVFIGLFLCGTHITTAQVKKVSGASAQKAKTLGLPRINKQQIPHARAATSAAPFTTAANKEIFTYLKKYGHCSPQSVELPFRNVDVGPGKPGFYAYCLGTNHTTSSVYYEKISGGIRRLVSIQASGTYSVSIPPTSHKGYYDIVASYYGPDQSVQTVTTYRWNGIRYFVFKTTH